MGEAYKTAVYIQNKYPHTALGRKTPEEIFTGTRPDVSHIRIFGSVFYCHVHADNRKKVVLERRGYLLVTTRFRRHIEFTFLLARGSL